MAYLNSYDSKVRKPLPLPKPLMLKDYLLDDLSSCSSNGFRSFPRRQCCTTVRFLLESDLKSRGPNHRRKGKILRSKSSNTPRAKSAFQRASAAVINAVKLLPFSASVKSPNCSKQSKTKNSIVPRSLSKKLLNRSFWKRTDNEIERWKSFKCLLEETEKPSDFSPSAASTTTITTVTTATDSNSSSSESNSWSDSEFTSVISSGNLERSCENDVVVEGKRRSPDKEAVSRRFGVTVAEATTTTTTKNKWPNEAEKEQCSPVSVLDCPFDDDDEVSSPFQRRLARMEGTKRKLMQKIKRFENIAELEPLDLSERFSSSESTDESPDQDNITLDSAEEEVNITQHNKAVDLLELIKSTTPPSGLKSEADNLLLDFIREEITEMGEDKFDEGMVINVAKDWMNGRPRELFLEWELEKNRQAYVRGMEKGVVWSNKLDEERAEVALELEAEVFASLVNELLLDLF